MAEHFDVVTWMKDFEQTNGRPPTLQEVENAQDLLERYVMDSSTRRDNLVPTSFKVY